MHGKKERPIKTIDDIWNRRKSNPYITSSLEDYTIQIKKMNKIDLFSHAAELGVKPTSSSNRALTERKLIAHFRKTQLELNSVFSDKDESKEKEIADKVKKIMAG